MATFNKFQDFVDQLGKGTHDLSADTVSVYLSNATPSASLDAVKADLAEIATGGNYTGAIDTQQGYTETGGTGTMTGTDVTVNATATVGPFQYVVLQNETPTSPVTSPLIGWWDHGSAVTLATGESYTIDFGASVLTIT